MTTMAFQITSLTVVYSAVYSDADQRKHQSSASLAFVWGIHRDRWIPRTKGQLRRKCFHLMTSACICVFLPYVSFCPMSWNSKTFLWPRTSGLYTIIDPCLTCIGSCGWIAIIDWISSQNFIIFSHRESNTHKKLFVLTIWVRVMTWRRIGDKLVSESMLVQFIDAYFRLLAPDI